MSENDATKRERMNSLKDKDGNLFNPREVSPHEYYEQVYQYKGLDISVIRIKEGSQIKVHFHIDPIAHVMGYNDGKHYMSHWQNALMQKGRYEKWFVTERQSRGEHKINRHHVHKMSKNDDSYETYVSRSFFVDFLFTICTKPEFTEEMKKNLMTFINGSITRILEDCRNNKALIRPDDGNVFGQSPLMKAAEAAETIEVVASETIEVVASETTEVQSPTSEDSGHKITLTDGNWEKVKVLQKVDPRPNISEDDVVNEALRAHYSRIHDISMGVGLAKYRENQKVMKSLSKRLLGDKPRDRK